MKPCVVHPGRPNNKGYVARLHNGRMEQVHRIVWIKANGPIPSKLEVDHICSNRACVELTHLRLLAHRANLLASPNTLSGRQARQTHCHNGHAFDADNTYITKQGKRQCRQCRRDRRAQQRS